MITAETTKKLKYFIEKIGLLPLAKVLVHGPGTFRKVSHSFIFYLFNNWLTFFPIYWVRRFYLQKVMGIIIGRQSFIHMGCIFYSNVKIGKNSVIGRRCSLLGDITIKNNVSITAETYIFSSSHFKDSPTFEAYCKPVVIEDYAWIGARAMILPGVTIGKGAILGAASTATKNIAEFTVCVGTPAKPVGERSAKLDYNLVYFPYFQ
jgi:maltose O-acetyltransferase